MTLETIGIFAKGCDRLLVFSGSAFQCLAWMKARRNHHRFFAKIICIG
jgi:hypothetical protein